MSSSQSSSSQRQLSPNNSEAWDLAAYVAEARQAALDEFYRSGRATPRVSTPSGIYPPAPTAWHAAQAENRTYKSTKK